MRYRGSGDFPSPANCAIRALPRRYPRDLAISIERKAPARGGGGRSEPAAGLVRTTEELESERAGYI